MEQSQKSLFYPLYGVCILESVEQGHGPDNQQCYYNLYFPKQELRLYIPEQRALQKHIRPLSNADSLLNARTLFFGEPTKFPLDPSQRRPLLQMKLESGLLQDHFGIIRDMLCAKDYSLKLNTNDRSILSMAKEMLINELMHVLNISAEDAATYVKEDIEKRQLEFNAHR
ncbi:hypothetical protein [Paenibacillus sp. QZ-Y1]|uniref:hypothetical protein n=1 Tax=Paenibacillus sp. QZ-Y1 TaxID=3414511 RepID=UPI003F798E83